MHIVKPEKENQETGDQTATIKKNLTNQTRYCHEHCPDCGGVIYRAGNCPFCPQCGWSKCL